MRKKRVARRAPQSVLRNSQFSVRSSQSSFEVYIEELVLHGFAPSDRYVIGHAFEAQLARLLGEQGLPPSLAKATEVGQLDGGTFAVPAGARPDATGSQIAQFLYRRMSQ